MVADESGDLGDEDRGWDVTSVASALTALSANHVDAELEALLDVLGVSDHVHVENAGFVELVDDFLGGHADGRDEEAGAGVDDDLDELAELALGVVVAKEAMSDIVHIHLVCCIESDVLGLSCTATNLWKQEINSEWCILVIKEALQFCNLLPEHVWGISNTTDDTDSSGVGDCGGKLRAGGDVHACKHDRVVDLEEVRSDGSDLLWPWGFSIWRGL